MRLVFAGTPAVAIPALDAIAGVAARAGRRRHPARRARRPRPQARPAPGRAAGPTPHGVPVLQPRQAVASPTSSKRSPTSQPDCCPVVAYGALVPRSALDVPRHGWVNLHFSLLPAWRGAAPVQRALMAGDEVTGATTFRLEQGLDTGPVFGVLTETIRPRRHRRGPARPARRRRAPACWSPPSTASPRAPLVPVPQPAEGVSLAPKVTVEEARVDWSLPAARGGPPHPRLHARARRLDDVPRRAAQARAAARGR